jgi:vacuolar-type H+-ATPase subunit E/Vma4
LIVRYLSFTIAPNILQVLEEVKPSMNQKHIERVLEIEKQAQGIQDKARREAQEIPVKAEQEAHALIAKTKSEAQEEARKMIAEVQAVGASAQAAADLASNNSEIEGKARANFEKAVVFVLERVIGRA